MFQIENFFNLGLTKDEYRSIIYTIKKNKHKGGFIMNKMKKVLMTMFGLVMLPYYLLVVTINRLELKPSSPKENWL